MTPLETELLRRLAASERENVLLRQKLEFLIRRMFGSSSEPISKDQLELLLAGPEVPPMPPAEPKAVAVAKRSRKERTQRLPEDLPVVEEVLEPEVVKAEPEQWRRIGEEVSAQLDYEPGRSLPAPGLLAHVLVSKYCDPLPLYRQEGIYSSRHGVQLPRPTLARWVELAADWLRAIHEEIRKGGPFRRLRPGR